MKFDMHCHTKEGSPDGRICIEDYIVRLKEAGFGGMLVSDHNSYDGYRRWKYEMKGKEHIDFVVLKGIEYDTIDAGHILVIMPEYVKMRILEMRGLPVAILINLVHRYGGILGPMHPCGERYLSIINTRKRRNKAELLEKFDFLETFNSCESVKSNQCARELGLKYNLPGFGGSDAHRMDCIGMAYTELPDDIYCESDLIKYIKNGGTITSGGLYYRGTVKKRIGKINQILLQMYWFYNRLGGLMKRKKRKFELKRDREFEYTEKEKYGEED